MAHFGAALEQKASLEEARKIQVNVERQSSCFLSMYWMMESKVEHELMKMKLVMGQGAGKAQSSAEGSLEKDRPDVDSAQSTGLRLALANASGEHEEHEEQEEAEPTTLRSQYKGGKQEL